MKPQQLVFGVILLAGSTASAAVFDPPEWDGQERSTCQVWDFATDASPAAPAAVQNSYGDASADIQPGEHSVGWFDTDPPVWGSAQGLWDLGSSGTVTLHVPNYYLPHEYEEIWVEVTYYEDIPQPPTVSVPGAVTVGAPVEPVLVELSEPFGGWFAALTKWRVTPSSDFGEIVITGNAFLGSVVDEVVVYTISGGDRDWLGGDANVDCVVDILDMIFVRNRINADVNSGNNCQADVNSDNKINILDMIYVRNHLNNRCED